MESWAYARALHVLGVVFWIGGVAMVTTVLLPALRRHAAAAAWAARYAPMYLTRRVDAR